MITIEATLEPSGQGKVLLNGQDISSISSGLSIVNSVHHGNMATITIPAPSVDLKMESEGVFFHIGDRIFRLLEIEEA